MTMKRFSVLSILGLMVVCTLAAAPQDLLADQGQSHRPRPNPSPTPMSTPTPVPVVLTAPALISPPNGAVASGQVTFMWSPVSGAACYEWEGGLTTNFGEQANLRSSCMTDTSYTIALPWGFEQYWPHLYWHVHARDRLDSDMTGRFGPWSETWLVYITG
jgi:hypothetical protein